MDLAGGIQWVNPLTMFGELNILVLTTSIIAVVCFLIAGICIYLYNKRFYVGEIPRGWKMFYSGLILSSLYQLLKVPYTYQWIYGDLFTIIFLLFQIFAIGVLVYGLYLLKREVGG